MCAVFSGQGSQYPGMAARVMKVHPQSRHVYHAVDEALGFRLTALMTSGSMEDLSDTRHAQPAILAHSIALAQVAREEYGVQASSGGSVVCAAGHSLGEYSALVFSGALALEDAARLVRQRGELMMACVRDGERRITPAMAALFPSSATTVADLCKSVSAKTGCVVEVANINSRDQVVISGAEEGVGEVERQALAGRVARRCVRLAVSAPFHCSLLTPSQGPFAHALGAVALVRPVVPVLSNVTAGDVSKLAPEDVKDLLVQQITAPVNWLGCVESALSLQPSLFLELGPGDVLTALCKKIVGAGAGVGCFSGEALLGVARDR